jgi:hypothetical protein
LEARPNPHTQSVVVDRESRDVAATIIKIVPTLASSKISAVATSETATQKHDDELEIPAFLDRRLKLASGVF